jgi:SnoaL-like domain
MSSSNNPTVEAAVLRANARFYRAFSRGDFVAMNELWAQHAPVTCLHPGSTVLRGRVNVLGAWRQIIADPPPFEMRCEKPEVQVYGPTAVVLCYEGNGEKAAHLAATNVFVLEENEWRMVHHQAGPLARVVASDAPPNPPSKPPPAAMN